MSHACEEFINCQKRFTSEYQPTPEAKKAGWENRRARKLFFDQVLFSKVGGQNVLDGVKKKIAKLLLKEKLTSKKLLRFLKRWSFLKRLRQICLTSL